ncbi:MAG: sensor domain-containing diguanylate cyclase [Geopsychrobacter sp.]|nr:sensor domain-containing diguanylate cyclase [Geopsychrobacter sp.]
MPVNYENLLENLSDGLYFVDCDRRITRWNRAAERITGYTAQEVIGSRCADNILVHVDDAGQILCNTHCPLTACLNDDQTHAVEVYLHHKDGHRVPVHVRANPIYDQDGTIIGVAELFTDTSEKAANQQRIIELEKLALLDQLTQLANRHYLEAELVARFDEMARYGLSFGLLFIDIDHFKQFNDNYGHDAGDLALQNVAKTLLSVARPFDLFGRWGGEEFIGIIRNIDRDGLKIVGQRCHSLIAQTYVPLAQKLENITVSMGATLARPAETADALLKRADSLMYQSKQQGRNRMTLG